MWRVTLRKSLLREKNLASAVMRVADCGKKRPLRAEITFIRLIVPASVADGMR
jgi:hypothetical protein